MDYLVLVKKGCPIPRYINPKLVTISGGFFLEECAAKHYNKMEAAAKADGIAISIYSAFRSKLYQKVLFDDDVSNYMLKGYSKKEAQELTSRYVAFPGESEHNTGLAADITYSGYNGELTEELEDTEAFKWLLKNASDYGFILRYPKGKEDITGVCYEPWHFRYVGLPHSKIIKANNLTLEEYIARYCT